MILWSNISTNNITESSKFTNTDFTIFTIFAYIFGGLLIFLELFSPLSRYLIWGFCIFHLSFTLFNSFLTRQEEKKLWINSTIESSLISDKYKDLLDKRIVEYNSYINEIKSLKEAINLNLQKSKTIVEENDSFVNKITSGLQKSFDGLNKAISNSNSLKIISVDIKPLKEKYINNITKVQKHIKKSLNATNPFFSFSGFYNESSGNSLMQIIENAMNIDVVSHPLNPLSTLISPWLKGDNSEIPYLSYLGSFSELSMINFAKGKTIIDQNLLVEQRASSLSKNITRFQNYIRLRNSFTNGAYKTMECSKNSSSSTIESFNLKDSNSSLNYSLFSIDLTLNETGGKRNFQYTTNNPLKNSKTSYSALYLPSNNPPYKGPIAYSGFFYSPLGSNFNSLMMNLDNSIVEFSLTAPKTIKSSEDENFLEKYSSFVVNGQNGVTVFKYLGNILYEVSFISFTSDANNLYSRTGNKDGKLFTTIKNYRNTRFLNIGNKKTLSSSSLLNGKDNFVLQSTHTIPTFNFKTQVPEGQKLKYPTLPKQIVELNGYYVAPDDKFGLSFNQLFHFIENVKKIDYIKNYNVSSGSGSDTHMNLKIGYYDFTYRDDTPDQEIKLIVPKKLAEQRDIIYNDTPFPNTNTYTSYTKYKTSVINTASIVYKINNNPLVGVTRYRKTINIDSLNWENYKVPGKITNNPKTRTFISYQAPQIQCVLHGNNSIEIDSLLPMNNVKKSALSMMLFNIYNRVFSSVPVYDAKYNTQFNNNNFPCQQFITIPIYKTNRLSSSFRPLLNVIFYGGNNPSFSATNRKVISSTVASESCKFNPYFSSISMHNMIHSGSPTQYIKKYLGSNFSQTQSTINMSSLNNYEKFEKFVHYSYQESSKTSLLNPYFTIVRKANFVTADSNEKSRFRMFQQSFDIIDFTLDLNNLTESADSVEIG